LNSAAQSDAVRFWQQLSRVCALGGAIQRRLSPIRYGGEQMIQCNRFVKSVLLLLILLMSACVEEHNPRTLALGNVSIGQQLLDLKLALDARAISETEYKAVKEDLIASAKFCASQEDD
jgi:hypothetical protein